LLRAPAGFDPAGSDAVPHGPFETTAPLSASDRLRYAACHAWLTPAGKGLPFRHRFAVKGGHDSTVPASRTAGNDESRGHADGDDGPATKFVLICSVISYPQAETADARELRNRLVETACRRRFLVLRLRSSWRW
jgi:hypothetical protein